MIIFDKIFTGQEVGQGAIEIYTWSFIDICKYDECNYSVQNDEGQEYGVYSSLKEAKKYVLNEIINSIHIREEIFRVCEDIFEEEEKLENVEHISVEKLCFLSGLELDICQTVDFFRNEWLLNKTNETNKKYFVEDTNGNWKCGWIEFEETDDGSFDDGHLEIKYSYISNAFVLFGETLYELYNSLEKALEGARGFYIQAIEEAAFEETDKEVSVCLPEGIVWEFENFKEANQELENMLERIYKK